MTVLGRAEAAGQGVPEGTPVIQGLMEVVDGQGEPKKR